MPRLLPPAQIDEAVRLLLAKETEVISRGRSGDGFAQRVGQLYFVYVEDQEQQDSPVSEVDLRAFLARLDLDDYSNRYWIWALKQLGLALEEPKFPA